ncbi:MAG: hypothetical protein ABJF04_09375 [Reichenbachiella sp.]|uniref:hypothetical protein n=1 Tax=Reichenbachiella sp. TaxID=2184521 RepID=UPI003262E176
MEHDYESLNQKDASIKLSPRQTDYLLTLLGGILELNDKFDADDIQNVKDIINKLEMSRAKG